MMVVVEQKIKKDRGRKKDREKEERRMKKVAKKKEQFIIAVNVREKPSFLSLCLSLSFFPDEKERGRRKRRRRWRRDEEGGIGIHSFTFH